jgi:hypothetical protein
VDEESSLLTRDRERSTAPDTSEPQVEAGSTGWKTFGWLLLSLFASFMTTTVMDNEALLESQEPGLWNIRDDAGDTAREAHDRLFAEREISSGHYGRECYGFRSSASVNRCNSFTTRKIAYSVDTGQSCPFKDASLCDDRYTAIRLSTGRASAEVIGLNSNEVEFDRTSVCTPVDLAYLHKRGWLTWVDKTQQYEYHLGKAGDNPDDMTFSQSGDPFNWDVPAYSVE